MKNFFKINNRILSKYKKHKLGQTYFKDAEADAIYSYSFLEKYLSKNKDILEVGGGIHLLTSLLDKDYKITSIEPGDFMPFTNKLRNEIIKQNKLKVHTIELENFKTNKRFDFIFSINVLEHTKDIEQHLRSCINLLKDKNSILLIHCPNYTFPFEPHFYNWFIPFFPNFTFKVLLKKKLIKKYSNERYKNYLDNLNFDCTYFNIKKMNFSIIFEHPLNAILDRLDKDLIFRKRLCSNLIIKICYKIIKFLKIRKLLISVFPLFLCPYLIMQIKKR